MRRAALILLTVFPFAIPVSSQHVQIPDDNFLQALIERGVDSDGDGLISHEEAESVHILDLWNESISDITGLEAFVNLDTLVYGSEGWWWLFYRSFEFLDVSNNTRLKYLKCVGSNLKQLKATNLASLKEVHCRSNNLSILDLSGCTALEYLDCSLNPLSDLVFPDSPALAYLNCEATRLFNLNLSGKKSLKYLNCGSSPLNNLDLSNNVNLDSIVLNSMHALHEVCVWTMPFPPENVEVNTSGSPDVRFTDSCIYIENVYIPDSTFLNTLIEMGLDANGDGLIAYREIDSVSALDVSGKGISDLTGIEAFIQLDSLRCAFNDLTTIHLIQNRQLTYLDLSNNRLESIETSRNGTLEYLDCSNNRLWVWNLANCSVLEYLDCSSNFINDLVLSNCRALRYLNCSNNEIHSLPLDSCESLIYLDCSSNQIGTLELYRQQLLTYLDCSQNPLVKLALKANQQLNWIDISQMPTLFEVCMWTLPFPTEGPRIDTTHSQNIYFTMLCEGEGDYMEENDGTYDEEYGLRFNAQEVEMNKSYENLYVSWNDDDWYILSVEKLYSESQRMTIACDFNHANGDINIELWKASWRDPWFWEGYQHILFTPEKLLSSSNNGTDHEIIEYPIAPGQYFLHVSLDSGIQNSYTLQVSLPDAPSFVVIPDTVTFDPANIYQTHSREFKIFNQDRDPLSIDSVRTPLVGSKITPANLVIEPGQTKILNLVLFPRSMGTYHGELTLYTSDPLQDCIPVPILVEGFLSQNYVILKEIDESIEVGEIKLLLFQFPNPSTTNELSLSTSIQTYRLPVEINDKMLRPEGINGSWVATTMPDSAVIPPGENRPFGIILDASELESGDYYADIIMDWYNPVNCKGYIPIQLHVIDTVLTRIVDPAEREVQIYPNPTSDQVTVRHGVPGDYSIEVVSMNGTIVKSLRYTGDSSQVDLSDCSKGVYFFRIRSRNGISTAKIVKL